MALFLSSKLRKAADTSLIEDRKKQLFNDHEEFIAFEQSEELQNYIELEREINSEDFKQNKKQIEARSFKGSELERKEKELKSLLKSKRYRVYSSVHEGSDLSMFEKMKESEDLVKYMELQAEVNSGKLNKKEFNEDWLLYKNIKKVPEIRAYFKFKKSNKYKIYYEVLESNLLQEIEDLKAELDSEEFISEKNFLLDKKRFEQSEGLHKFIELEKELKRIFKSKRYKIYKNVIEGSELSKFEKMKESEDLVKYMELQAEVNSGKLNKKEFNEDWLLYKNIKKVPEIRAYFKFKKSNKYKIYYEVLESNLLQEIEDLKAELDSEEFISEKNFLLDKKRFEQSESLHKFIELEKELKRIFKSKRYRIYTNVIEGSDLLNYKKMKGSDELAKYIELQADVNSGKLNKKEFNEDWLLYKNLKKVPEIRAYFKFKHSNKSKIYFEVLESNLLQEIEDLKAELDSEEFTSEKDYLLDKKRFEKTEAFNRLITYKELNESESFKKYFQFQKKNNFHLIREWELTFSENFEDSELDKEKWMTRYYWGDVLMNDDYALPTDAHIFSEKNIKISNSVARLETKKEKAQGKVWDAKLGFIPTDFDYTSALISTGKSFRQKYGLFEAKIKVSDIENVRHSFWMLSDTSLPHIDIARTSSCGKLFSGQITGSEDKPKVNQAKVKGLDWTNDFFIYSLEWAPNKLIWRINDVVVYTQTENIPHEPMYLILSSGVLNANSDVNAVMEIDWVKCYQRAQ